MRVAGLIAAALVALVVWYVLKDRDRAAGARSSQPAAHRDAVPPATSPRTPAKPALPSAELDEPLAVVDTAHATLQAVGRRCFETRTPRPIAPNEPDDSVGRLELRLHIRVDGGTASVDTAEVVATRRLRDDVRDCIVSGSREARWPVTAPDGAVEIVELFRMGDFIAVPQPDSPPSAPPGR